MTAVFCVGELSILMADTRHAYQILYDAHTGPDGLSHQSAKDVLAMSRYKALIIGGKRLAKHIIEGCIHF